MSSAEFVDAQAVAVAAAAVVLVQLESPLDAVGAALRLARAQGRIAMLNPAPVGVIAKPALSRGAPCCPMASVAVVSSRSAAIPDCSFEFAINASNYRHWSRPIRAYIDDCIAGIDGPRASNLR